MFIEQYWRLLKPGGRLLTVIDDSVLSGRKFEFVRGFIRDRFIIRAVISLHGDAFQRSGARPKTSVLYLAKRTDDKEPQPGVFAFESLYVGRDDVVPSTPPSVAEIARTSALAEMDEVLAAFAKYQDGVEGPWLVPSASLDGRLDAKFLRPWSVRELSPRWEALGIESAPLSDLVRPVEEPVSIDPDEHYDFLRVTYEGRAEPGEKRLGREISYSSIGRPRWATSSSATSARFIARSVSCQTTYSTCLSPASSRSSG
jgi:type I restriction enzyme M protein